MVTASIEACRYAGVGSRQITPAEAGTIRELARGLAARGYWLHSGNAVGADQAFQEGAGLRSVAFLPWPDYNPDICPETTRYLSITGQAIALARDLHPQGDRLSERSLALMARNVQIIDGAEEHPPVSFVLCCADPRENGVQGGSAMAYRVAKLRGIPFYNLREPGWEAMLEAEVGKPWV